MSIVILGAGRVGSVIASELEREHPGEVCVYDASREALRALSGIDSTRLRQVDLSDLSELSAIVTEEDLVVNAMPGSLGFEVLEKLVALGCRGVDIAFFEQDAMKLSSRAQESGAAFVYDCGVAPGMSNMLVGRAAELFDSIDSVRILVGGLPTVRHWPHEYKAVFSPSDVIEEYVRPARIVRGGKEHTVAALSEPEFLNFPQVGTLEAFNTDGLRSLIHTVKAEEMVEKTLRYPGHREKMLFLREAGFFRSEPIEEGSEKTVLDVTSSVLFEDWKLRPEDRDVTVMRVEVAGSYHGASASVAAELFDHFDENLKITSMARTTGYTACAVVNLMREHRYSPKGVEPPEFLARSGELLSSVFGYLTHRNVLYSLTFAGVDEATFFANMR